MSDVQRSTRCSHISHHPHTAHHPHPHTALTREKKSRSCEDLLRQTDRGTVTRCPVNHLRRNQLDEMGRPPLRPDVYSFRQDNYRSSPHTHFECPVEVQAQRPHQPEEVRRLTQEMEEEFLAKRKVVISGLPFDSSNDLSLSSFLEELGCIPVSKVKDCSIRVLFPSSSKARDGLTLINSTMFKCHKLSASYGHPDSLLFVGNLPYTYTCHDLVSLFEPCGNILRCFVVCSTETGLSKGYGFVEFSKREGAINAKQQKANKVIGLRSLRVDFSDNGMQTCEDLHSQTLFVDRLPKGFIEDGSLKEFFSEYGRVNFCQVAVAPHTGVSRGFAFVDMSSSREAEHAQLACNGGTFHGHEIRVSFGMPCRHGACILQNRNNGPYCSGKLTGPTLPNYPHKLQENTPFSLPHFHHNIPPNHREEMTRSRSPIIPLRDSTNCQLFEALSSSVNCSLMRSASLTNLSPSVVPPPSPVAQSWGISKSASAPTVLTPHPSTASHHHKDDSSIGHSLLRKRSAPELDCYDGDVVCSVYDKPYVGQHQQGIPFLHPLKRIRMDNY